MDISKEHTGDIYTALRVKRMGYSWSWDGGHITRKALLQAIQYSISTLPDFPTSEVYGFKETI